MKKANLLTLGMALLAGLAIGCDRKPAALPLAELQALKGKPVLVHFWASWCPPCLPELPQIIEFASRVKAAGWTVLAVSTDSKSDAARAALPKGQALPENFKVVFDPQSKAAEGFGSYVFPESYWINAEGQIQHKWVGPQDWEKIAESGALGGIFKSVSKP